MALSASVGSLTSPNSTGNQSYTGVGFQPKALIFWGNGKTADGTMAAGNLSWGAASSSSSRATVGFYISNGVITTADWTGQSDGKAYRLMQGSTIILLDADLVSMDSDGFTLNWVTSGQSGVVVNYLALGGADVGSVFAGSDTNPTSTGNHSVTAPGFKPTILIPFQAAGTTTTNPSNIAGSARPSFGVALSSSSRLHMAGADFNAVSPSSTNGPFKRQVSTKVISSINSSTIFGMEADFVSFDTNGFTLNFTTVPATARFYYYLCMNGNMQVATGTFNESTGGTGNQAVTGVGFQPVAIILFSFQNASSTSIQNGVEMSFGAGTSSSARGVAWYGDKFNTSPTQANTALDRAAIVKFYSEGTPTLLSVADLVSLDSNGFTINWTTNDNTAREIGYIAFGSAGAANPIGKLLGTSTMPVETVLQAVNRAGIY